MSYLYIVIADILLGIMFLLNKKYQSIKGASLKSGLKTNFSIGLIGFITMFIVNGFTLNFSWYSFCIAIITNTASAIYTILGLKILRDGKVSIYSVFLMTGGMVLPFLYGVIFNSEKLSVLRVVGLVVMILAIILINYDKVKPTKKQIIISLAVFFLNGLLSIFSKIHQSTPHLAVDTKSFVIIGSSLKFVICFIVYLFVAKFSKRDAISINNNECVLANKKQGLIAFIILIGMGVVNTSSYLFQLIGAIDVPATVLYPLISGGSILITTLLGIFFYKEKHSKLSILGIILSVIGTCAFI